MEQQVLLDQLYGVDQSRLDDRIRLQGDASLEHQSFWMNFGIWNKETRTLAQASYNLACFLGEHAQLNCEDCVLNVGFGAGDELLVWNRVFNVKRVFGVEAVASQVDLAKSRIMQRSLQDAIIVGLPQTLDFRIDSFQKFWRWIARIIFTRD
jgi:cyclopropane fatty-acyl-phospholipid synthase-like methyltransferase